MCGQNKILFLFNPRERYERGDQKKTALRETREELGIPKSDAWRLDKFERLSSRRAAKVGGSRLFVSKYMGDIYRDLGLRRDGRIANSLGVITIHFYPLKQRLTKNR